MSGKQGGGTRDEDRLKVKVKGDDPEEVVADINETVEEELDELDDEITTLLYDRATDEIGGPVDAGMREFVDEYAEDLDDDVDVHEATIRQAAANAFADAAAAAADYRAW